MITNNEKLALAQAVYEWEYDDRRDGVYIFSGDEFDPEHNANQCHECWDKLVDGLDWSIVRSKVMDADEKYVAIIWRQPAIGDDIEVYRSTELAARTAAMIQLPAVQELLKEIEHVDA